MTARLLLVWKLFRVSQVFEIFNNAVNQRLVCKLDTYRRYFTYILQEVPPLAIKLFPIKLDIFPKLPWTQQRD